MRDSEAGFSGLGAINRTLHLIKTTGKISQSSLTTTLGKPMCELFFAITPKSAFNKYQSKRNVDKAEQTLVRIRKKMLNEKLTINVDQDAFFDLFSEKLSRLGELKLAILNMRLKDEETNIACDKLLNSPYRIYSVLTQSKSKTVVTGVRPIFQFFSRRHLEQTDDFFDTLANYRARLDALGTRSYVTELNYISRMEIWRLTDDAIPLKEVLEFVPEHHLMCNRDRYRYLYQQLLRGIEEVRDVEACALLWRFLHYQVNLYTHYAFHLNNLVDILERWVKQREPKKPSPPPTLDSWIVALGMLTSSANELGLTRPSYIFSDLEKSLESPTALIGEE